MRSKATLIVAAQVGIVLCEICVCMYVPRVEKRGLTTFARRNKACVSCKFIQVILSGNLWFLQNILDSETRIIAKDSHSNWLTFEDTEYTLCVY